MKYFPICIEFIFYVVCRLITMATRHFGNVVAGQMRCLKSEQLPMLLVISRARATNEVIDMIPGQRYTF